MNMNFSIVKRRRFWILFIILIRFGGVIVLTPYGNLIEGLAVVLCLFEMLRCFSYNRNILLCLIIVCILLFASCFLTDSSVEKYLPYAMRAVLVFLFFSICKSNISVIKTYLITGLWLICYLGLINFFLSNLFPFLYSEYINSDGYAVKTIGFIFNSNYFDDGLIKRNQALFWEPGVYQILINILLYIILIEQRKSIKDAWIPILVLISTMSTTGFVILGFILFVRYFILEKSPKNSSKLLQYIMLLLVFVPLIYSNMSSKLTGDKAASTASRLYDYYMGVTVVKSYPLMGIGLDPTRYSNLVESVDLKWYDDLQIDINRGNTNSIVSVFMYFGIPIGLIFLYSLYHQNLFVYRRCYFVIILLSLLSEPLYNTSFLFLHIFSVATPIKNIKDE